MRSTIPRDLLTGTELCAALKISKATLSRYVRARRIPVVKVGAIQRFSESAVMRALTSGKAGV